MTKNEYVELYEEYYKTDSIKRREEIEDAIEKAALELFKQVRDIFDRYGARKEFIDDSDYREDSGFIGLAHESDGDPMLGRDHFYLRYSDSWQYGGYCNFTICIHTKWFDLEERKKLARELREKRIKGLEASTVRLNEQIAGLQKKIQQNDIDLERLKAEEAAEDNGESEAGE